MLALLLLILALPPIALASVLALYVHGIGRQAGREGVKVGADT